MLYDLFGYLDGLDIPGAGMFSYVSFRALTSLILSLVISMVAASSLSSICVRKSI